MANCETDEEDYMSDAFLAKCSDPRPGLLPERISKRYKKELEHKEINRVNRLLNKPRSVLESEHRSDGLKNALSSDNKGFKLLAKMGYKPQTGIGKHATGIIEPIPLQIKVDRGGLGQESEKKRKQEETIAMRAMMARKRHKHEAEWRDNLRAKLVDREVEKDLCQSQKVCEQLDSEQGTTDPQRSFFWPVEFLQECEEEDEENLEEEDEEQESHYGDGDPHHSDREPRHSDREPRHSDRDPRQDQLDALLTSGEKLEILTDYLRSTYFYCVWCGIRFENETDLASNCPGNTANDHN